MEPSDGVPEGGIAPTEEQYVAVTMAAYDHARRIGQAAANGAAPWELVRGLAMMVDELDRVLGWHPEHIATDLWSTSDALRAEARESAVTRPREMEDE